MSRVNKILNQKIWDTLCDDDECGEFHVEIKPEIRKALIKIAYDFLSFLDAKIPFKYNVKINITLICVIKICH